MLNPYSVGKKIYLRAPIEEDVTGSWYQWLSDPEITAYLGERWWPNTIDSQRSFFDSIKVGKDRLVLSICDSKTDQHIGVCNLSSISWVHRNADVALIIGDKSYRNGTYAIETLSLLLQIAFNRLNLLNLKSAHMSSNPFTPVLEKMFGFNEVGRLSNFMYSNGEYVDLVISQLKKNDWDRRNQIKNR
jgi:ribosomal-protein-alanine N-acetyltransferase